MTTRASVIPVLPIVLAVPLVGCIELVLGGEAIQGSGRIASETYTFDGLTGVELGTLGELDIRLGDAEELRVSADDNLLPYIEATQHGGVVRIGSPWGVRLQPSGDVRYTLTVRALDSIGLSSSGNARAPALAADRFEIHLSSSGDLFMDRLDADQLDVALSSSGSLTIDDGAVHAQEVRISSSGDYDGEAVRSRRATARLSSSGSAWLWVDESLEARLSSSGSVYYRGEPDVRGRSNSSGRTEPID